MAEVKLTILGEDKTAAALKGLYNTEKAIGMVKTAAAAMGISLSAALAVGVIKDVSLMAARYETLGVTMGVVGNNAGYTAAQMDGFQQSLMKAGIAMNESRQNLTTMAQAHIDLSKSADLARIAQDAAVIGGINSSEAFSRMIYGIQSGQVEVLRTIGINVNFENSYKKLGIQLGKSAEDLTELEKAHARTNAVMEKGKDISGSYEAAMGTAGKQITSMQRYIDNLKITVGSVFNDALIVSVEGFTGALKTGNKEANEMAEKGQLKQWGQDIVLIMAAIADGVGIAYSAINTLVITGVAGFQQLYYGATAFMQALNGDFSGAKESFNALLATGEAWAALVAKQWENTTKYQDAARKMFADRDNQANKSALLDKQNAAEAARIAAGNANRATEAAKEASLANEKNLERQLAAMKTEKAAENALSKEQASMAVDILKDQYDQGLVITAEYHEKIRQISDAAAQQQFDEAYKYLQKEKELLASIGQNKGESSPEYAKELNHHKQLIGEVALAWLGVEKAAGEAERQLISSMKAETAEYKKLNIATLEASGNFEEAEGARQSLSRESAEYLRMEANAAKGNAAAAKALADQHRLDAIATAEGFNKTAEAERNYAEAADAAKDSVDALNGKDAESIANGVKIRNGLGLEEKLRRDLALAQLNGTTAAVNSLTSEIKSQETLNARLRDEIALRERKGVLTGAIVGYNGNTPIYADGYAKSQAATGYVSNSQLLSGGAFNNGGPSAATIQNSPFVSLGAPNPYAMASYAVGTDYVPETGLYELHKGEAVLTAAENITREQARRARTAAANTNNPASEEALNYLNMAKIRDVQADQFARQLSEIKATATAQNKAADSMSAYAEAAAVAEDAVGALNGKTAEAIAGGAKLRMGLEAEAKIRSDLNVALIAAGLAAVDSLTRQIESQAVLNSRLGDENALRERNQRSTSGMPANINDVTGNVTQASDGSWWAGGQQIVIGSDGLFHNAQGYGKVVSGNLAALPWDTGSRLSQTQLMAGKDASELFGSTYSGLPRYEVGTPYVPSTGPAIIHKGERIITAADNAKGNFGNGGFTFAGTVQITIQESNSPEVTADVLARQLLPKLDELFRRRRAA